MQARLNSSMYRNGSKVDVKIMNVTFQSALANKNKNLTSHSVPVEPEKQKPRKSKRLVVDRIVGGKIMRAEPDAEVFKRKLSINILESPIVSIDPEFKNDSTPFRGALTHKIGKSSPRNL